MLARVAEREQPGPQAAALAQTAAPVRVEPPRRHAFSAPVTLFGHTAYLPCSAASSSSAACLSSGWLLLPHLGDWIQLGHPSEQGHSATVLSVACHNWPIKSKPFSAMPMPPGCAS